MDLIVGLSENIQKNKKYHLLYLETNEIVSLCLQLSRIKDQKFIDTLINPLLSGATFWADQKWVNLYLKQDNYSIKEIFLGSEIEIIFNNFMLLYTDICVDESDFPENATKETLEMARALFTCVEVMDDETTS